MGNENKKGYKNKKLLTLIKLCKKFKEEEPKVDQITNRNGKWIVKIFFNGYMYGFEKNKSQDRAITDACIQA